MVNSPVYQPVSLVKQEIDMNDIMLSTTLPLASVHHNAILRHLLDRMPDCLPRMCKNVLRSKSLAFLLGFLPCAVHVRIALLL